MDTPLTADRLMRMAPVIPVLVIEKAGAVAHLAQALVDGGLAVIEVTLRTAAALDAIASMASATAGAIIGAGTVLNADQLKRAVDVGARFIVSPGLTEAVARAAESEGVPLLAGVSNASDIMRGLDLGLNRFKFFPAETSGGVPAIAAFAGPFADVAFCPTGGINAANAAAYLAQPTVLCVGGAWVAPKAAIAAQDWGRISRLAQSASSVLDSPALRAPFKTSHIKL